MTERLADPDLAMIFQNAFPNTLDTTVRWHVDGSADSPDPHNRRTNPKSRNEGHTEEWAGAQSFIVTGDINAAWLRDSTNQLAQYQSLAKSDPALHSLILGAINTQAEYVIESPYCNAFQPPPPSRIGHVPNGQDDTVHPMYEPSFVFECKYELDSLAAFLSLTNQFYTSTGSRAFLNRRWYMALETLLNVLEEQAQPTFSEGGKYMRNEYTFQRRTDAGTETLNLGGIGNPIARGTGLIRSAFRPSDDATILPFFIPANAMMAAELQKLGKLLTAAGAGSDLIKRVTERGNSIEKGIWEHGVIHHKTFGDVFAFEVDGYGSSILMDDANLPSLLSLPLLGFVPRTDKTYQNTRRMILSQQSNPYFLAGSQIKGIGGPHIGLENAWPMSLLVQAMTSDDDAEIMDSLSMVRNASQLGLVHESVNVNYVGSYTRSWFAWANSVFAQTVLDLAARKPELIFKKGYGAYKVGGES